MVLGASRRVAGAAACLSVVLGLSACATTSGSKFDVDSFLRASDSALPEVLGNAAFLSATRVPANDCAVMLQSSNSGVLEDLPPSSSARGPAWLLHPAGKTDQVWLIVSEAGGERTCHGPLPADAMKALAARARTDGSPGIQRARFTAA
ncbi:hypothetical protein AWV79_16650 [Cupriavidus sp. UYMMa02A]|nr:hypothetical protein AWV79_16650 [Cupriavidus sp. UYMMa02A]